MAIEHIGRLIILNDTQANVEAEVGALAELVFGRNTATGAIGYTIDAGATWTWLPSGAGVIFNDAEGNPVDVDATAAADGTSVYAARRDHRHQLGTHTHPFTDLTAIKKYCQFLTMMSGGEFYFICDVDGNPVTGLFSLE